jgi:DNA-binding response OmpR family regulator
MSADTPPAVLVADDDTAVRRTLAALLAHAGFAVTPAADGTEALALLTDPDRGFAAAVLDCRLEGLTGPEVLTRARPARPTLPVLVVCGSADPAAVAAVRADPHARFLAKPFRTGEFVRAVSALVRG